MKHWLFIIAFLLSCSAAIAQQASQLPQGCRKDLTVDEFLLPEDAANAKQAFETFREALLEGNHEKVISLMSFPADFVLNGYGTKFESAKEFTAKYDDFFTEYVIDSTRAQDPEQLLAGWNGVLLSNGAVRFTMNGVGEFRITNIQPKPVKLPDSIAEFLDKRFTCPPVVIEGRVVAYDSATHLAPGFENIYLDHLIVDVIHVLTETSPQKRIRVDFWGVTHLPDYNLPQEAFQPGSTWKMYLRSDSGGSPSNEVCEKEVQESISIVDESGREQGKLPAIKVLTGQDIPSYVGLSCFETSKQFFIKKDR